MADHRAIAAAGVAICRLLHDGYPRAEFGDALVISTSDAATVTQGLVGAGFAVCLWRVTADTRRRAAPIPVDRFGRRFNPPLPLDLGFLIIPHAENADRQARLLGWLLRTIADAGRFSAAQLNAAEPGVFGPDEVADLILDPLALGDHLALCARFGNPPPAANTLMRSVSIDSAKPIAAEPPVVTG